MKRFAHFVLAWSLATLAGGGAHAGAVDVDGVFTVPVVSMKEGRYLATERQQYDFSCGSAALSTLLTHHYGFRVGEQAVFEAMYREGEQAKIQHEGFSLLDMKRYLESQGFEADGFEAPLEKLAEAKVPGIALMNERGYNHFVVVKGLRDGRVLVGDPAGGTRALTQAEFESRWVNRILFVITNRQDRAVFNAAADWRVVPRSPLTEGIQRDGVSGITMPRLGPSDF